MSLLPESIAASDSERNATDALQQALSADFDLLTATRQFLEIAQRLSASRWVRIQVPPVLVNHAPILQPMFDKYGIELVPSQAYVGAFDARVIGTNTEVVSPLHLEQNNCGQAPSITVSKEAQWAFPQAGKGIVERAFGNDRCNKVARGN